jgi:hypothetical protein
MQESSKSSGWAEKIPEDQWQIYQQVIELFRKQRKRFSLGGAFALAAYTGRWRNTKDLDLYILPGDRDEMIRLITSSGFQDYYDVLEYDRSWIFRAHQGEVIIDLIWAMANARVDVDELWLTEKVRVDVRGESLPVIPVEELIWAKLYVLQPDRCDWPDVLNLVHALGPEMDWEHLLARMDEDAPLLSSLMAVFRWLDPERARQLPQELWARLHLPIPETGSSSERVERRASRLDSRPWFHPLLP